MMLIPILFVVPAALIYFALPAIALIVILYLTRRNARRYGNGADSGNDSFGASGGLWADGGSDFGHSHHSGFDGYDGGSGGGGGADGGWSDSGGDSGGGDGGGGD